MLLAAAAGLLAAASPDQAAAPAPATDDYSDTCTTIADCIDLLTGEGANGRIVAPALIGARLSVHGRAGADALLPLLAHPSAEVRRLAAIAVDLFEELEPRHLPALIAAHRRGLDVAEAIARTGSDEALHYLEAAWSVGEEGNPARWALPLLGRRAEPFLMRELERCRQSCSGREAQSILHVLDRIGPLPDEARAVIRDVAASASVQPELRREMEDQLVHRGDPAALPIIVRRLGAVRGSEHEQWEAARLLEQLQRHDEAGGEAAGPLILHYLSRPELRRSRNAAVVTSWVTGHRPAIPVLRSLLAEAERDWLLAYDALMALAELGGREARPEIARLARDHWYRPVRNNARRALSMLDGGAFELPEGRGETRGPYAGELLFAADVEAVRDCRLDRASEVLRFGRDAPVPVRWPRRGAVRIQLEPPSQEALAELGKEAELPPYGEVTLLWQRAGGRVAGVDGGRWDGGLFAADASGRLRRILTGDVLAVFDMAGGLFVFTGDAINLSGEGDLWRVTGGHPPAVVDGPVRLPASPDGFALASDRTLLIRTERGDVAVGRDGRLRRPRPCPGAAPGQ